MKIWQSVSFTKFYEATVLDYGHLCICAGDKTLYQGRIPYNEAVKLIYQLKRELNKPVNMYNNPYNPMITEANISGYLE